MDQTVVLELLTAMAAVAVGGAMLLIVHLSAPRSAIWGHILSAVLIVGRVIVAGGLLGVCSLFFGLTGLVVWLVLIVLWIRAVMNYRAVERRNLLSALALAADKEVPLAPMARAFAEEQGGPYGRRVEELATGLEHGAKLRDLPARWRAILPREMAMAVRVGLETGDLKGALRATANTSAFDRSMLQPVIGRFVYLGIVILYLVGLLTFLLIKVMPAYVKIFDDFGTRLPSSSIGLISVANFLSPLGVPLLLFLLAVIPLYAWLQWRGTLRPRLPVWSRVVNWVDMAPVLRMFELATRRGRPLGDIMRAVAEHHPKRSVRTRMWSAAFETDDGLPWQDSLVRHRLLNVEDAALLCASERSGNLAWTFGETAASFERKASLRLQGLAQVLMPLVMLPIGLVIAWVALAYFAPVVRLISDLS